jgi:CubicO group peptidase (beta-lactamase class C family)
MREANRVEQGRRMRRTAAAVAVTALALGVTAGCTAEGGGTPKPITVELGDAPNQDVMPLYTDRDAAVTAAVKKLPGIVERAMKQTGVPGAQVAVVSKGKTIYQGAFGVRDMKTGEKVDDDTVFLIASLSKPISSTVISKALTEDDKLAWTTPVHDLMPDFTMKDPYVTANAQVGDYFAHRTGIPTGGGDDLEDLGYDRDYILAHLKYIPLAPFRITYQYSNFGLTTGAEAIAEARGETWEKTAQDLLFTPLGMTSTSSSHAEFISRTDRAVQHARTGDKKFEPLFDRNADAEAPAGGVSSTAGDVAKWMTMVLDDGEVGGKPFIDPAILTQAFSAQIVSSHNRALDERPGHYGFGINVGSGAGGRVVLSHSGAFGLGTATAASMVPDLDLGIVVLTNGAPIGLPEAVDQEFLDNVMYGKASRDWVTTMEGYFANFNAPSGDLAGETAPTDAAAPGPAADYVGTYESPYFGAFTVTEKDGKLQGAMGPDGGYTFAIDPWNGDTMAFAPSGENALPGSLSSAVFTRAGGRVTGVTLTYFNKYPQVAEPSGLGVFTRTR